MCTYRQQRGAAPPSYAWLSLAGVLLALLAPPACEGRPSGSDPAQPIISTEAALPAVHGAPDPDRTPPSPVESDVFEEVELATGQRAALKSTGLRVLLVDARGQRPDCIDCPNRATLQATLEGEGEAKELHFSLSGNMPISVMARARRKEAHGYVFIMIRIVDDNVRFRIEPADSEEEEE